ncbi:hypothetical protein LCGC14_2692680, partial [marine sediment metagenome]
MTLLPDPGFENLLALTGGGPQGNEIAKLNHLPDPFENTEISSKLLWPSNHTQAAVVGGGIGSPHVWIQQDVDDTGGFKIRQFPEFNHGGQFNTDDLMPDSGVACALLESGTNPTKNSTLLASDIQTCFDFPSGDEKRVVGWRIDPGAVIDMTLRIKGLFSAGSAFFVFAYYSDRKLGATAVNVGTINTTYLTKTNQIIVPETVNGRTPKYVKLGFVASFSGGGVIAVD